ncbi:MAG: aldo/keto reductase [Calditrichia bacterium]
MENSHIYRTLGKSGLKISALGLGCWQFSKGKGLMGGYWPSLEVQDMRDILKISMEGGINWFDTAEAYGWGESERSLSNALHHLGKENGEIIIATKWWPLFRFAGNITKTIDKRLKALNGFGIDLYQIHQPFSFSTTKSQMKAMAELVSARKIRFIGVSNFSAKRMRLAQEELSKHGLNLISNQVRYNLLDRKIETNGILDTAERLGVSIIAYSPLAQGLLTGKFHDHPHLIKSRGIRKYMKQFRSKGLEKSWPVIEALKDIAGKYSVTPSQVALNWLINFHGDRVLAIPGATKVRHAEENTGALRFRLTDDEMGRLDAVSRAFRD